jgi:hypothetical protein
VMSISRFGPPAGFGYPLDGLLPPSPCRLCFTPTALVGLAPSESSPFRRYRAVSGPMHPPTVFSRCYSRRLTPSRTSGPRFLGFDPSESPSRSAEVESADTPVTPVGFFPSRAFPQRPGPAFRQVSAHTLTESAVAIHRSGPPSPTGRVSASQSAFAWPKPVKRASPRSVQTTLLGFLRRLTILNIRRSRFPSYGFTTRRVVHHCRPPAS